MNSKYSRTYSLNEGLKFCFMYMTDAYLCKGKFNCVGKCKFLFN